MQRKELNKAIKEYSHRTNFYKPRLIKAFLKKQRAEEQELLNLIPKISCPSCKSRKFSTDFDDDDYSSSNWLICDNCGKKLDDDSGYIKAVDNLECLWWDDRIEYELHFNNPNINSQKWKNFCEKEIKKYLGIIKDVVLKKL